jgi:hypothetical protein
MFLRLDSSIRNWVFIPITLITISVNLIMKYLNFILNQGGAKVNPSNTTERSSQFEFNKEISGRDADIKIKSAINRTTKLRSNFMHISDRGFNTRKAFFCNEGGFFSQKFENKPADMMNPNMMGDMLKKNVVNALYYIVVFGGIGYMFSGFILLKLPFGLTQKFRSMLQQGLNLPDVDVSYVSAISWCFILVFGLNSILQHFDGGDNYSMLKEQEQMMKAPMQMMSMGQPGADFDKILSAEKENVEIIPHFTILEEAPDKLIEKYKHLIK